MIFFNRLEICKFFIEIEKYYGEYRENMRAAVFAFAAELDDYERAALYNELIENYPTGFGAPDVYRFNLHFKKAKTKAFSLRSSRKNAQKTEERYDLSDSLARVAADYGLDAAEDHLFSKILKAKTRSKGQ